ncbi:NAD-dependent deacylase [soil metagenome]
MNLKKKHIVVLTGAGISAESGLKTFRDNDGLWMGYNIEDVATPQAFKKDPKLVLDFYNMRRRDVAAAKPNDAHYGIAVLEKDFKVTIITQNIDDLHERAGSKNIIHLHGEIFKMRSEYSDGYSNPDEIKEIRGDINLGNKAKDGGQLRPHIVWFNEPVPLIEIAQQVVSTADIFVVVGTSLQVYPAAGLVYSLQDDVPKYIIDKKIPSFSPLKNLHFIEKPATEGVEEVKQMLMNHQIPKPT